MDVPTAVAQRAATVDAALATHADRTGPRLRALHPALGPLADELRDYVLDGGKRLRPVLLLLGHEIAGGDPGDVLGAAVAVELLHTCALLHDDVIDDAPTRRGRPTTHLTFAGRHREGSWSGEPVRFGEAIAILLGDLAFVQADEALLTSTVPPDALLAGLHAFTRLREEVMAGQALDVLAAATRTTDADLARTVATLKSGRYSVTRPLQLGAVLAGADDDLLDALEAVGDPLGRAFQFRDDLLGVFGDQDTMGKSATGDLAEGKRTLLVAQAWAALDDPGRQVLAAGLGRADLGEDDAATIRALMTTSGARAAVEAEIDAEVEQARAALDVVAGHAPGVAAVGVLREFTGWFAGRVA